MSIIEIWAEIPRNKSLKWGLLEYGRLCKSRLALTIRFGDSVKLDGDFAKRPSENIWLRVGGWRGGGDVVGGGGGADARGGGPCSAGLQRGVGPALTPPPPPPPSFSIHTPLLHAPLHPTPYLSSRRKLDWKITQPWRRTRPRMEGGGGATQNFKSQNLSSTTRT